MADHELAAHATELLQPLGTVRARRMFGGHGFYVDDLFIAIIAFDRLFLKTDLHTRGTFEAAGCEPFVYEGAGKSVTVGYYSVPPEAMESPALMLPWARLALDAALRARAAKKNKPARKTQTAARNSSSSGASARAKSGSRRD